MQYKIILLTYEIYCAKGFFIKVITSQLHLYQNSCYSGNSNTDGDLFLHRETELEVFNRHSFVSHELFQNAAHRL